MEAQGNEPVMTPSGGLEAADSTNRESFNSISTEAALGDEAKRSSDSRSSYGGPSQPPDTLAALIRKASSSAASGRSLPPLVEPGDADYVESSFDPVNLLEVGLREWRNRTLSLQCLKRSRTIAPDNSLFGDTSPFLGLSPRRSFQISNYRELARCRREHHENLQGEPAQQLQGDRTARLSDVQQDGDGRKPSIDAIPKSNSLRTEISDTIKTGIPSDFMEDFSSSLTNAPHASLIGLVLLYHQALYSHGLVEEAQRIAGLLEGLQDAKQEEIDVDLQGMDLLLKDGLLALYLRIQPYLPPVPSQVQSSSLSFE